MSTSTCPDGLLCKNDGLCEQDGTDEGTFMCRCVGPYAGLSCEYHAQSFCNDRFDPISFCTNGGTCKFNSVTGHNGCLNCGDGYYGDRCEFPVGTKIPDYANAQPYPAKSTSKNSAAVWGGVIGTLLVVAVGVAALLLIRKRRRATRAPKMGPSTDLQLDADGTDIAAQFSPRKQSHSPTERLEDDFDYDKENGNFDDMANQNVYDHDTSNVADDVADYQAVDNVMNLTADYPAVVDPYSADQPAADPYAADYPVVDQHAMDYPVVDQHAVDDFADSNEVDPTFNHTSEDVSPAAPDQSHFLDISPIQEPIVDEDMDGPMVPDATVV